MEVGSALTICDVHQPRAVVLHDERGCPLCEAMEKLIAARSSRGSARGGTAEDVFGLPRELHTGGCWDGEG